MDLQTMSSLIQSSNGFSEYSNNLLSNENLLSLRDIFVCNGGDGGLSAGTAQTLCLERPATAVSGSSSSSHPNRWSRTQELYMGSVAVVGLFLLFRVLQKSF